MHYVLTRRSPEGAVTVIGMLVDGGIAYVHEVDEPLSCSECRTGGCPPYRGNSARTPPAGG